MTQFKNTNAKLIFTLKAALLLSLFPQQPLLLTPPFILHNDDKDKVMGK